MKTPKRILVAHADAHTRRMLTMLLVESGLIVQAVEPETDAVTLLRGGPFDLALIGHLEPSDDLFALSIPLRELQPDLPIVMLLPQLELPLVVQGIRHGLTDVLPLRNDPKPVVRRILSLVGVDVDVEPTAAELAEVEATLSQLDPRLEIPPVDAEIAAQRERLWRGLRELHLEREVIAAAQMGMDEKARMLSADREQLRQDREKFAGEIAELKAEGEAIDCEWRDLENHRAALEIDRKNLARFEADLREREARFREQPASPPPPRATGSPREHEAAWDELRRARAAFAAERAVFRDDRMALADLDQQIHRRETQLKDLGEQVQDLDRKRRGLPLPPPKAFAKPAMAGPVPRKPGLFKSFLGGRT